MTTTVEHPDADSVRDRKKRATRTALRRAAIELVSERGLHAVTAEEIAVAAGVSPRTFFNYFASKEDAVVGFDPFKAAEVAERLRARPAGESAFEALRAAVLGWLPPTDIEPAELLERMRVIRSDPHLVAHHSSRFGELERALTDVLAERGGAPGRDAHAALVVACVLAAGRAALMEWCSTDGRAPLERVLTDHLDRLAAGLADPERSTT